MPVTAPGGRTQTIAWTHRRKGHTEGALLLQPAEHRLLPRPDGPARLLLQRCSSGLAVGPGVAQAAPVRQHRVHGRGTVPLERRDALHFGQDRGVRVKDDWAQEADKRGRRGRCDRIGCEQLGGRSCSVERRSREGVDAHGAEAVCTGDCSV